MTDHTVELHNNTTNCLHSVASWGYTTYVNVCTGEEVGVGWGNVDYAQAVSHILLGMFIFTFCLIAIVLLLKDVCLTKRSD